MKKAIVFLFAMFFAVNVYADTLEDRVEEMNKMTFKNGFICGATYLVRELYVNKKLTLVEDALKEAERQYEILYNKKEIK